MGDTTSFNGCKTHGPWGSSEGDKWVYMPHDARQMKITVGHGDYVGSIAFQTNCCNSKVQNSRFGITHSSKTCSKKDFIYIDYPKEYIVSISGTYGCVQPKGPFIASCIQSKGPCVVSSICFMTNLNLYGPYGSKSGHKFSSDINSAFVVGFHGRTTSQYLTALGVYTIPRSLVLAPNPTYADKIMNELTSSVSRISMPRDAGPWGASGGKPWDDGFFSTIKHIYVHLGELNAIYAVQLEYLKSDGKSVLSQMHGGTHGSKTELVKLDCKDEYLTAISGFYGPVKGYKGLEAITSITFHTSKKLYGPYGEESGAGYVYFSSTASPGKIAGFHGRCNGFLSAISVHMKYF